MGRAIFQQKAAGSALIVALIFLGVLTMVGVSITLTSTSQLKISANSQDLEDTFWATNAGANLALSETAVGGAAIASDAMLDDKAQSMQEYEADADFLANVLDKVQTSPVFGFKGKNKGKELTVSMQQNGKGTSCPRSEKGSSVTKIACDYFEISSSYEVNGYKPAVKLGVYREMVYNNAVTHQEIKID